jgi:hypothetical protein
MAVKLTKLPKTQYSGLDYQNIIEDVVSLVTENPEYSNQYDDFLSSNAGRTITELFAFIADQLATRIDWVVNENFLGTATQKNSVIKILKLLGYNFQLSINSNVQVTTSFNKPVGDFYLTEAYDNSGTISPFTLSAEDKNGVMRTFEAINFNNENNTYDYKGGVQLQTGSAENPNLTHYVEFYEGTTYIEQFVADVDNNPIFTLSQSPVIENSVQVYLVVEQGGSVTETRLNEVNSFLDPNSQNEYDAFGNELPLTYKRNVEENDTITIEFPPTTLVTSSNRRLREGDRVRIFYRIGGGIDGNITARSINVDKTMLINGQSVGVHFINEQKGTGGRNGETAEYASVYAPFSIRTAGKAVTEEDYNIIVNADNTVIKAQAFGNNNITPSTVYNRYGNYIHPLEVWLYILKDKPAWEDVAPSRYNDFQWITLRLENRLNEMYSFRDGEYGYDVLTYSSELDWETDIDWDESGSTETFNNYVILETPSKFKNNLIDDGGNVNTDLLFKITEKDTKSYYFSDLSTYNEFYEPRTTNDGLIEGSTPTWKIVEDVAAKFKSEIDLKSGINLSSKYMVTIGFDNNPLVTDIDLRGSTPSETSAQDIIDIINDAFTNSPDYNNGVSGSNGFQELGLSVDSSTSSGLPSGTAYNVYINGVEYTITIDTTPTYTELATLIEDSTNFTLNANINAQSVIITNVDYDIELVQPGMAISGDGILEGTFVENVSVPNKQITLTQAATITGEDKTIILNGYSVTIEGTSPTEDIRITNIGTFPKYSVRVEPGLTGNDLLTALPTIVDPPNAGSGKSGYQRLGLSNDLTAITPLSNTTQYYFKVNGYEYSITTGTDNTYNDIITLLDTELDPNYTVQSTEVDVIEFLNDTSGPVLLEEGESGTDLLEALLGSGYTLDDSIGGGDYSTVAKTTSYLLVNDELYVELQSPITGKVSQLDFSGTTDSNLNASEVVFGIRVGGSYPLNRRMFGQRKLTVIINKNLDSFGNVILENGSINFYLEQRDLYFNYLIDNRSSIDIGTYYNENYGQDDPAWRIVANRVYNTVYDQDRLTIDLNSSEFFVRFTKEKSEGASLYMIENDWSLDESSNATVESLTNPQDNINASNYFISLQFDNKPTVDNIDITADGFVDGSYTLTQIINNINDEIRNTTGYSDDLLYANFDFASINNAGDGLILRSPLKNNNSKIIISPSTVNDAVYQIFGLVEEINHEYYAIGDYFIDYDESRDVMTLNKLSTDNSSNMPDLNFYFHFIFDKRYVEEIYDGKEGRPGFQKGVIDEDIYEATFSSYKIVGLDHVYKETKFKVFDIKANIYYNKIYSKEDVSNRVENNIKTNFGLESIDFGQSTPKSRIMSIIHEIDGVEYVILEYLGPDAQDLTTNVENAVDSGFNEIAILSEDVFLTGQKIHGLMLNYFISEQ